jgi:DNA mismatch repair protein MutL
VSLVLPKAGAQYIKHEDSIKELGLNKVLIFAARAPISYKNQNQIYLFVNGRPINDKRLAYSLREAYSGLIEVGMFPAVCVCIDANPIMIDVNIHPQKKEIRWPQGFSLASIIYRLLRPHLELRPTALPLEQSVVADNLQAQPQSQSNHQPDLLSFMASFSSLENTQNYAKPVYKTFSSNHNLSAQNASYEPVKSSSNFNEVPKFSQLRVVGELGAAWLLLESEAGLVIVDQHAAHERIQFERILKNRQLLRAKPMLVPHKIKIPYYLEDQKADIKNWLESFSFELDEDATQKNTLTLIAVPEADRKIAWDSLIEDVFTQLKNENKSKALHDQLQVKIASSLACHSSVRRGQRLTHEEISALLNDLDKVDWKGLCPHGRPLWYLLSHNHIEEIFHR